MKNSIINHEGGDEAGSIMMLAGEKSGDDYGAKIATQLIKMSGDNRKIFGTGGNAMARAGVKLIYHIKDLAYLGYWEPLKDIFVIRKKINRLKQEFIYRKPKLVILIDYPGFNLYFAKFIKRNTNTKIIYYIPPTIWAWKENRIAKLKKYIDHLIVIFPFERSYYQKHHVAVNFFGHPLYGELANFKKDRQKFCDSNRLDPSIKIISIMLGSRNTLFKSLAPIAYDLIKKINAKHINYVFVLCLSDSLADDLAQKWRHNFSNLAGVIFESNASQALLNADLCLCNSGTTALEATLLQTPAFFYIKIAPISAFIVRLFFKKPWFSITNFILQRKAMLEFVQEDCTVDNILPAIHKFFADQDFRYDYMKQLSEVKQKMHYSIDHYRAVTYFILSTTKERAS
ncbi:MAG: lipid-A-disaccharide synthase [SAR324 cluster bacterium]|nr:lipid-A-disaccharide synthase [SAR324 cluster bacterium]